MKTEHTPGPWLVEGLTVYALMDNGTYRKGEPERVNRFWARVDFDQRCPADEAEANARLIASAPDLLEALKAVRDDFGDGCTAERGDEIRAQIAAAIAKAEGKS